MRLLLAVEVDVARVIAAVKASGVALRGIMHAAGFLKDALIAEQSWEQFQAVLAPKVTGGELLHRLTLGEQLDFFVLFSSASAIIGNLGQSNYASANAFLDGLATYRR